MMARLDGQPPSTQKAILHHLDVWTGRIGSDRIALDEHMSILERDMGLPHEKVQSAMMLAEAMADMAQNGFRLAHGDNQGNAVSCGFDSGV
jgi:hypothetical protein